ncbi:hypothetical protein LguiB_001386 [Lonicera macranthoides]
MGYLITKILIHFYQIPRYKKELAIKPLQGTYNIGSWNRSLAQAPIYERVTNDADDHFLQMKVHKQTESKGRIVQGPARGTAAPSGETEYIKGVFVLATK